MMPDVSVIVPCFNAEAYLRETLESALAQEGVHAEIIAVDDGSTDGTWRVIESFGVSVRGVSQTNAGASAARNRGAALAQGEYLQYLDADDLLAPGTLARRVAALAESGADVAYSDWRRLVEDACSGFIPGEVVAHRIEDVHPEPEIAIFTGFWAPPAALLYRRRIVTAIGGWNETLPVIQDARFLLDAALNGARFVHVPGVGADYRVHRTDSLSRRDPVAFVRDVYRNTCQVQALWEAKGLTLGRRQALIAVFDYVAREFFVRDMSEFRDTLARMRSLAGRPRFGCPELAAILRTAVGHRAARAILRLLSRLHNAAPGCGRRQV